MRCQFCNYQFTLAGHYGRHLHKNHSGKELRASAPPKPTMPDPQGYLGTVKRRRMSSVGATRRLAYKPPNSIVLTNVNIENTLPDPLNPHSPAEELLPLSLQVEQTLTLANKPPPNSTVLTNVNIENTLPDPLNRHSPAEELLPLSLQVGQVICQSLFIHVL